MRTAPPIALVSDCCRAPWGVDSGTGWPTCDGCDRTCALVPPCRECHGQGMVLAEAWDGRDPQEQPEAVECPRCHTTGVEPGA